MTRKAAALSLALPAAIAIAIVAFVTLLTLAPPSDAAERSSRIVFVNQFFNDCEPDCSKAYDNALNTVRPDGKRGRRLGSCRRGRLCDDNNPSYSPDGRRLAFDTGAGDSSGPRVMVSRADGSRRRALRLPGDPVASEPTWSPDGRQLAFVVDRDYQPSPGPISQRSDIFIADADGSHLRALTNGGINRSPDWSSAGLIAFTRDDPADPTRSSSDIYTVDPTTGAERRLTHRGARTPDWSPDGGRLAFSSFVGRLGHGPSNIFVLDLETSRLRRVGPMVGHDPAWSPDGRSLAYGCGGICRISARGGRPKLVARPPRRGRAADGSRLISPDWQPRPVGLDRR